MYCKYLKDPKLFELLYKIDRDLALEYRRKPCPHCGDTLHFSNYRRKPRRLIQQEYSLRFSVCCSNCRKRVHVPSTLFFSRFVYGSILFIILSTFLNHSCKRDAKIQKHFGVSSRTLQRWKKWWDETFINSSFWKEKKALILKDNLLFPRDLFLSFSKPEEAFIFFSHFK